MEMFRSTQVPDVLHRGQVQCQRGGDDLRVPQDRVRPHPQPRADRVDQERVEGHVRLPQVSQISQNPLRPILIGPTPQLGS